MRKLDDVEIIGNTMTLETGHDIYKAGISRKRIIQIWQRVAGTKSCHPPVGISL